MNSTGITNPFVYPSDALGTFEYEQFGNLYRAETRLNLKDGEAISLLQSKFDAKTLQWIVSETELLFSPEELWNDMKKLKRWRFHPRGASDWTPWYNDVDMRRMESGEMGMNTAPTLPQFNFESWLGD